MELNILKIDPYLEPYKADLLQRMENYKNKRAELVGRGSLVDFANGYEFFGIHRTKKGWVYREWAPAADAVYFTGDFNGWDTRSHQMTKKDNGVFEIELDGRDALCYGQKVQAVVINGERELRRIPLYATRVVQDPETLMW